MKWVYNNNPTTMHCSTYIVDVLYKITNNKNNKNNNNNEIIHCTLLLRSVKIIKIVGKKNNKMYKEVGKTSGRSCWRETNVAFKQYPSINIFIISVIGIVIMNGIVRGAGNRNSYLEGWIMEDGRDRFLLMLFRRFQMMRWFSAYVADQTGAFK